MPEHNAAAVEPEALSYFDTETLAGMLPETPPDTVLVDGHHPVLARTAARWAKAHGRPVVVDAGSWKPVFRDVFGLADVVACSAQFTAPENALADVPVVVTTAGPDPVRWRGRNGSGEVAVPVVEARDTLGAGDVWHGAFVSKVGASTACSGCGIKPTTFPRALVMPAMSRNEPLGFSPT